MMNRLLSTVVATCAIRYYQFKEAPEIVTRYLMLAITIFLLTLSPPTTISNAGTANMLDEAVSLARTGYTGEAIRLLQPIFEQEPNNSKVYNDLIVILCWNNQPSEACALFEQYDPKTFPAYVLETIKKAYLELNQNEKAENINKVLVAV